MTKLNLESAIKSIYGFIESRGNSKINWSEICNPDVFHLVSMYLNSLKDNLHVSGAIPDFEIGDVITYNDVDITESFPKNINRARERFFVVISEPIWGQDENCDWQWLIDCLDWTAEEDWHCFVGKQNYAKNSVWEEAQISCLRLATENDFDTLKKQTEKYKNELKFYKDENEREEFEIDYYWELGAEIDVMYTIFKSSKRNTNIK